MTPEAMIIESMFRVVSKDGEDLDFILNDAQRLIDDNLTGRDIIPKARQEGVSTYFLARYTASCLMRRNVKATIISHETDATARLLQRCHYFLANIRGPSAVIGRQGTNIVTFPKTDSMIYIGTAGSKKFGRGDTITHLHCCMAPDTPVVCEDGIVKPVRAIEAGEWLLTHTGKSAQVKHVWSMDGGDTIIIHPWLGEPIEITPNHKIFTDRGWIYAGDVTTGDVLALPVREISNELHSLKLRDGFVRSQGGGRRAAGEGAILDLGFDVGFFFGYYLAEGFIKRQVASKGKVPCGVIFGHHQNEVSYAKKAASAVTHAISSYSTRNHNDCLSADTTLYGSPLAELVLTEFGDTGNKHIPDWVWECSSDFCAGLLKGYLFGDGSKTQEGFIRATTVCSSIATQIRDLAASLGLGFGSIKYQPDVYRYEIRCKPTWSVTWSGDSWRLIEYLIYGRDRPKKSNAPHVAKYKISGGFVWINIRDISVGYSSVVYDIEVDHEDHSFRTPYFSVSNSEYAYWPDPKNLLAGLFQAVPKSGEIAIESTGNGQGNDYHRRAMRAFEGKSLWRCHFLDWQSFSEYTLPINSDAIANRVMEHLIEEWEEPFLVKNFNLNAGQILWRRMKLEDFDYDLNTFKQEYPMTIDECFQSSGNSLFQKVQYEPTKEWVKEGPGLHILTGHPNQNYRYVIGGDPSGGTGGDNAAAQVLCLDTMEQVAEFASNLTYPDVFGHKVVDLATTFNNAYVVIEANNHGPVTLRAMKDRAYPPHLIYSMRSRGSDFEDRHLMQQGFRTSRRTKPILVGMLRTALAKDVTIHSPALNDELSTFIEHEDGKLEAQSGCLDDLVIAMALANIGINRAGIYLESQAVYKGEPYKDPFELGTIIDELKGKNKFSIFESQHKRSPEYPVFSPQHLPDKYEI